MHTASSSILEIKDLNWGYPEGPMSIFKQFSLDIGKGDFLVIMGSAGSGKSTLAKLITGQIKAPSKSVFYKKDDISTYTDDQVQMMRRKLGIIFQDYQLIEEFSVKENIEYPLKLYEVGDTIVHTKYQKIKQKLNLTQIENKPVKWLSSGQKQKVAIARALIHDPEIIIADEPTGNLDWESTQELAQILIETNKLGNTIVLITHDIHLFNYLKEHHGIKVAML